MKKNLIEGLDRLDVRFCKPLKTRVAIPRRISSFDIETHGPNNEFLMGSLLWYEYKHGAVERERKLITKVFYDKQEMIDFMINYPRFRHPSHIMFATNLQFDITSLLENTPYLTKMKIISIGTRFLLCSLPTEKGKIKFYDTLNHAMISVKKMGELIGLEKLESPSFLTKIPVDKAEWKILTEYNIRDSLITLDFSHFLQDMYNETGCNLKITLPSSAMDLYRRKYMKEPLKQPPLYLIKKTQKAYRGGRTEVFRRGLIKDVNYYDVNSMYPAMMVYKDFPDPNSIYHEKKGSIQKIEGYEGVSQVTIYSPTSNHIPYLPYNVEKDKKLYFPTGILKKQWYTHFEIRQAIKKYNYKLINVHETIYYTKTHKPFRDFISDIYGKRMFAEDPAMKNFYKLLMNSLYGKWGQKTDRGIQTRAFESLSPKEYLNIRKYAKKVKITLDGNWIEYEYVNTKRYPTFINPIYSCYITAYARDYLLQIAPRDVYYMDTDSLMTQADLTDQCGMMLGELKLEKVIKKGILVRPKFYMVDETIKIKGVPRPTVKVFTGFLKGATHEYTKFSQFKESIRRKLNFNQVITATKRLGLEDSKRSWSKKFNPGKLEESMPIHIVDSVSQ